MNLSAFIYLLLMLIKLCYSKLSDQCTKSNTFWYSLKYPFIDILKRQSSQSLILTCPLTSTQSCCTQEMSKDMTSVSDLKLKGFAEEKLEKLLIMFSNDSFELMNIYLNDLEKTKNDLNQLFSTTYGYNYKIHREFFFTWFNKLKLYMQGRLHNIGLLLDNFFLEMAQRIVRILITSDASAEVTACHTTRLLESKPYQDTDMILKKNIVRSYPPARLLVNSLAVARDVFGELIKNVSSSSTCIEKSNSLFHCMLCRGLTLKPCSQSCNDVMDNCFSSFKSSDIKKLDRTFTRYIKNLIQLAGKLDNPSNFPEVNSKMNVQISSAIMNIQNMYPNLKEQIKTKCQASRRKRQASKLFYKWQNTNNNNININNNNNQPKPWWEQTLAKNVNEEKKEFNNYQSKSSDTLTLFSKKIKQKYKVLENYFKNQRTEFCSVISTSDFTTDCWNGTRVIKNTIQIPVKESKKKAEKADDPRIKSAITQLNEITKRINSYLTDKIPDPETVVVQEYKLNIIRKVNKPEENNPNQKVEGSGELEGNNFPQPNPFPDKPKSEQNQISPLPPLQPDKPNWPFPALPEGSGEGSNKFPLDKTKKPVPEPVPKISTTTTSTSVSSSLSSTNKSVPIQSTKQTTAIPNQIPDDEDLNPPGSSVTISKVKEPVMTSSSAPSVIIQPEGSGNQPPDMVEKKPSITTTPSSGSQVEGSGEEFSPRVPVDNKPGPFLPMLPESSKPITEIPVKKPDPNPDGEPTPVEGSGKAPETPIDAEPPSPPIQPPDPSQPNIIITESPAITTSETLSPEQYPGKVPSEVWLPGLEGVKNPQKDGQRSTPSGKVSSIIIGCWNIVVCQTTLILLWVFNSSLL